MLASVLNSNVAVQASVYVVRAFVQMRAALMEYADLSRRIDALAATYDHRFQQVFTAIRDLMAIPDKSQRTIGFVAETARNKGRRNRENEPTPILFASARSTRHNRSPFASPCWKHSR